jgi:hypothetical protein
LIERQHVWLGQEATSFDELCEACVAAREEIEEETYVVHGTLRVDADVGFTTCRRGHRNVERRVRLRLAV